MVMWFGTFFVPNKTTNGHDIVIFRFEPQEHMVAHICSLWLRGLEVFGKIYI